MSNKELIEQLLWAARYGVSSTFIAEEAVNLIEQQQKRIEDLERTNSSYKNLTEAQEKQMSALRQRLYELRGADKTLDSERAANEELTEQLASSQAREAKLREALALSNKALEAIASEMTVGDRYTNAGEYLIDSLIPSREALSQPTDDTALREIQQPTKRPREITSSERLLGTNLKEKDMKNEQLTPVLKAIVDRIFGGDAGDADSIAVEGLIYNLQHPGAMTKAVYLQLQSLKESMVMAVAQGEDCVDGFDERYAEIARLMDAAPWVLCPDNGCVPKANKLQAVNVIEQLQKELQVLNLYKNLAQEFGVLVLEPENLLEAIAYKAGEVMRKRCVAISQNEMDEQFVDSDPWYSARACRDSIREISSITLEDLK